MESAFLKRGRGRPRKFSDADFKGMSGGSVRSKQNYFLMKAALEAMVAADPQSVLPYIENLESRKTILAELGRIKDPRRLLMAARYLAETKLPSRKALAYIRRVRGVRKEASAYGLYTTLKRALLGYKNRYPNVTSDQIKAALNFLMGNHT